MDHVSRSNLDYFRKPPLGGRPNTKPGDHGTLNAHNRWFILFYHVWGPVWIDVHWNSIWLRARSHMTSHYTWESVTTLHDLGGVLGRPLDTSFWAHNFMVTAFGPCVKWPVVHGSHQQESFQSRNSCIYLQKCIKALFMSTRQEAI
jgi:hypothetical protein